MKRVWIAVVMVALIGVVLWFLWGADKTSSLVVNRPYFPLERETVRQSNWRHWWPEPVKDSVFTIGGKPIAVVQILQNGFDAHLQDDSTVLLSYRFVSESGGKTTIGLTSQYRGSLWTRLSTAPVLRRGIADWLAGVQQHFENDEAVYGAPITRAMVKDSVLISMRRVFDSIPATADVYAMIGELRAYTSEQGAENTNHPMVTMYKEDGKTIVMTALGTSKRLPATDSFFPKRMELGYILEAMTTGGSAQVSEIQQNLALYARDYDKTSPAIPYQLWITNRMEQPDSSKWMTGVYFPIMY